MERALAEIATFVVIGALAVAAVVWPPVPRHKPEPIELPPVEQAFERLEPPATVTVEPMTQEQVDMQRKNDIQRDIDAAQRDLNDIKRALKAKAKDERGSDGT